jgi:hypothetical protein
VGSGDLNEGSHRRWAPSRLVVRLLVAIVAAAAVAGGTYAFTGTSHAVAATSHRPTTSARTTACVDKTNYPTVETRYGPFGTDFTTKPTDIGLAHFPTVFGGLVVTEKQTHLDIYLTKLDPKIERAIEGRQPPCEFTFLVTRHSVASVAVLDRRILRDMPALMARGIRVQSVGGPDVAHMAGGQIIIGVTKPTPAQVAYLYARYGKSNIVVEASDYVPTDGSF